MPHGKPIIHEMPSMPSTSSQNQRFASDSPWTVFLLFLRLGLTSFGGPVAHLGYFRDEFVIRRRWLAESTYADLMALCQFLPGPSSSQMGIALGLLRAGFAGAVAAWVGFTLPSAVLLCLCAIGLTRLGSAFPVGLLHGLKLVAVAVVAQAVWGMAHKLCPDRPRVTIAAASACIVLMCPQAWGQIGVIVAAALIGLFLFKRAQTPLFAPLPVAISRRVGGVLLCLFFGFLFGLPLCLEAWPNHSLALVNAFYRAGSLVFGGGHVMLPLLQAAVVPNGWVTNDTFLAGYGMAQAVPGPLSTFAAFLGASMLRAPSAWLGALVCLVAIFTPSFLLVLGTLPFWVQLRHNGYMQAALVGVNAAVVGILLAALYHPVWTSAIFTPADFGLALTAFVGLAFWRVPPWLVVLGSGGAGWLLSAVL